MNFVKYVNSHLRTNGRKKEPHIPKYKTADARELRTCTVF